jgi:hypothetical protein
VYLAILASNPRPTEENQHDWTASLDPTVTYLPRISLRLAVLNASNEIFVHLLLNLLAKSSVMLRIRAEGLDLGVLIFT